MSKRTETDRLSDRFDLIVNAPALFNALVTASELDVFGFLAKHPHSTFDEIQRFAGIPPHKLRVLLQAVCATELLVRHDGRYANTHLAEERLAHEGPGSWRHILLGWRELYYPAFAELTTALRTGTNTALSRLPGNEPTLYGRLGGLPAVQQRFHAAMSAFSVHTVGGLLQHADLSGTRHLLDIGGGDGTTAALLAERYPHLAVTIFDNPSVAQLAQDGPSSPVADRVRLSGGDLFADDFPGGIDAVLFSHVLEIFDEEGIVTLLAKAHATLPSGGRVFVYGFNVSDDETAGVYSARLSLYLNVLASGQGMAYPASDYEQWLRRVGFTAVETVGGLAYEHGLTVGVKP